MWRRCYKNDSCCILSRKRCSIWGKCGTRCVAMSLCALIYRKIRRITSVNDMIQIMTVGSKLYSSLPLLARQSMLILTELPEMFTVLSHFSSLNTVKVILVTCMGMSELRGGSELQLIHFNCRNYWC